LSCLKVEARNVFRKTKRIKGPGSKATWNFLRQ
jgi:hypothetical protein